MEALMYLYKQTFLNRVKKAVRKPVTWVYIIIIIAYAGFVVVGMLAGGEEITMTSPVILAVVLSGISLVMIPANIMTYAKRKGLIFRPSDTHFVFTAPISPKAILFYAQIRMILMGIFVPVIAIIAGIWLYDNMVLRMLLYFFFACGVENVLETSLMMLLYGNERFSEQTLNRLRSLMWLIIIAIVAVFGYMIFQNGMRVSTFTGILFSPALQLIPIIGWNIATLQLIIMGANTVNIICLCLYVAAAAGCFILARRMKCTGEYYEDAAKFADDYQEIRKKSQKGEVAVGIGKKKKYKAAAITYKGTGAKAIFYRQLLEYKKGRFFIFGFMTMVALITGIGLAVFFWYTKPDMEPIYAVLGIEIYMCFIFSAYVTKWSKELESPYTFMIPDTPVKKLWYATLIEHIRSFVDGSLFVLPLALLTGMHIVQVILLILIYVCINANKLYTNVLVEYLLGSLLGNTGKQFTRMGFQGGIYGIGIAVCVLAIIVSGMTMALVALTVYAVVITGVIGGVAASIFSKMESIDS